MRDRNWMRWLAAFSTAVGIGGLSAASAFSSPPPVPPPPPPGAMGDGGPPGGFPPGSRTFSNPFAGAPAGKAGGDFFDDEDEDDLDFPDEGGMPQPPGGRRAGSTPPPPPPPAPTHPAGGGGSPVGEVGQAPGGGVTLGGTNTGVVSHNKVAALHVDDETAEGSREVVTDFNYPDADILDIAKALGKLTGKNFILDKDVKGRITIISNSPVTVGDAWKAFLTALDINGFALIPSGKMIRIARQRDARDKQLKTYTGDYSPDTDALITRLFPLKYLSAEEVARNFRSFMPANSRIIPYEQTNTVIVTDTGSNIAKLEKLLQILDVEGYDAGIEVIPVKYASAVELAKLIDTLVPGTAAAGAPGGAPRFGGAGKFTARRTKEGGIINTIIADDRTNTLIVHANTKGADQIRELIAKLDQKVPAAQGGKVHVVYLQFAEAEQIANTLNNLSSQASAPRAGGTGGGGTGTNPVQASLFEGSIKVAPDKATNSLVITAMPQDFATLQRVIARLDIPRDQVFAEVVIMELNLGRDFSFSSNIVNPANGIGFTPNTDLIDFIASPFAQKGFVLNFQSGNKREVTVAGQKVKVSSVTGLIKALQTNSNANILATPQILTLDNTEATFETAERIPFPTSTAVQGAVSTSVSKENVSLAITLKPQINKVTNFVKLDIQTKLADISRRELPAQVKDLALATVERTAKTSIVVADSDTAVLGGLMRDNTSEQVSKVPILGDIPLLGWLFKAKSSSVQKTNLLIFITPHIVRQYEKIRAVLDKKLRERDDFIEQSMGGEDPSRKRRDEMIRDLPDLKQLLSERPQNIHTIEAAKDGGMSMSAPLSGSATGGGGQSAAPAPANPAAPSPEAGMGQAPPAGDSPPPPSGGFPVPDMHGGGAPDGGGQPPGGN